MANGQQCMGNCATRTELRHADQVKHIMIRHEGELAELREELRRLNEFVVFAQMVDASHIIDDNSLLGHAMADMLIEYRAHEMEKEYEEFDGLGVA